MSTSFNINVMIKTPNKKSGDEIFKCNSDWKVEELKKFLSENHISKPPFKEQRLIYCGRLLKNEDYLKNVFEPKIENSTFTLHLVYNEKVNQEDKGAKKKEKISSLTQTNLNTNNTENLNSNVNNQENLNTNLFNNFDTNAFYQANPNFNPLFMQMYQQMYIDYMTQYLADQQQNNSNLNTTINYTNLFNTSGILVPNPYFAEFARFMNTQANLNPNLNITNNVENRNAGQFNNNNDNNNNNNNQINREFHYQTNIASIIKLVFKIIVFSSLILAYSSIGRTILVFGISFIFYFYNLNRQAINNHNIRNVQNVQNNENVQNVQNVDNVENVQNAQNAQNNLPNNEQQIQQMMDSEMHNTNSSSNAATENNSNQTSQQTNENIQPTQNKLRFLWMVITSIFTSLVPEHPTL